MNWKTLSLVALIALIVCVAGLYLTHSLIGTGPVTIGIQVIASGLWVWARLAFGARSFHATANPTDGGLVTSGPYKYIRHPIYAAILYFVWAGIACHLSLITVAVGLLATALTGVRITGEERLIVETYPEYRQYSRTTTRVIPFIL